MNKLGLKILGIVGVISIISVIILVASNVLIFRSMFSQLQQDAVNCVGESLEAIDEEQLEELLNNPSLNSGDYQEIQQAMLEFKADKDIRFFYTMAQKDEDTAYILVDAALTNTSPLGEEYDLEEEMLEAFQGNVAFTHNPVEDDYGTFISAYAPIKNSSGEIIAIAGVDMDVSYFLFIRSKLLMVTAGVAVVLIALSVILSLFFSRKISSGVNTLNKGLEKFAEGDLTKVIRADTGLPALPSKPIF